MPPSCSGSRAEYLLRATVHVTAKPWRRALPPLGATTVGPRDYGKMPAL